ARGVVDVDDQLARDQPVAEGDDPGAVFEAGVDDESRRQALVHGADVANGGPDALGAIVDEDFLADRRHTDLLWSTLIRLRPRTRRVVKRPGASQSTPASCSSWAR